MSTTMLIFPWNGNFETGIEEIDLQHQQLVDLLNELASHLSFHTVAPALGEVFGRLSDYAAYHFGSEEKIWLGAFGEDPWLIAHQASHEDFIRQVSVLHREEGVRPLVDVMADVVSFLTHWLALHIIESDKRMAKAALALRRGASMAEAKKEADEAMAGSTGAMIETVMTMYDELAGRTIKLAREIARRAEAEHRLEQTFAELKAAKASAEDARVRNLLEVAPFPILITRASDGTLLYGNQRASAKFQVTVEESRGRSIREFYRNSADRDAFIGELRATGHVYDREVEVMDWHGTAYWALISAVIVDFDGEVAVMTAINDIDNRKKAELELSNERTRLETLIQTLPEPVWLKGVDGTYILCNKAFENFYGIDMDKLSGASDADLFPSEKACEFAASDRQILDIGMPWWGEEWQTSRVDGRRCLLEVAKAPVRSSDGGIMGVLGIARDITEIKRDQFNLGERIKEQHCLILVSSLTEDLAAPLDDCLGAVAARLGEGWQFPDLAEARIEYAGRSWSSAGWTDTPWRLSAEAKTAGGAPVVITVAYRENRDSEWGEAFLSEERELVEVVAARLAGFVDRKRSAEEHASRQRLIGAVFEQASDAILLVDPATERFVDFNRSAHESLGYTKEEFANLGVADIQAAGREVIDSNLRKLADDQAIDFETVHRAKDGSLRDVVLSLRSIESDGQPLIIAIWRDITDEKLRQRQVAAYQEHLEELVELRTAELSSRNEEQRAIFQSATTGIVVMQDRIVMNCNRKMCDLLGYTEGEVLGKSSRFWYPDEETFLAVGRDITEAISRGKSLRREYTMRRKDGTTFWARINAQALFLAEGPSRNVGIVEDVSEEREAAEAMGRAKEAAEEANRAKSVFLANMSHEIRTPLNAVIGMAHLALTTALTPRQRDYLLKIERSGQHLLGVINDILDFSKIEAGKLGIEQADFDLERLLGDMADFLNERIGTKGIELLFDVGLDVPRNLVGDRLRIGQILLNFGSNAVKFTERGEVHLSVRRLASDTESVTLRFAVSDTGIGIDGELLSRLFGSFEQADMSTTRKYGGTGLGLAISKRLADLMGGSIAVESEVGRGSTFSLSLRLGLGDQAKSFTGTGLDLRGRRVLVLDRNHRARKLIAETLRSMSFEAAEVGDGNEAINEIESAARLGRSYEFAFIGCGADLEGLESAGKIARTDLAKRPRLILVASQGSDESMSEEDRAIFAARLRKPVTPSTLLDTIMDLYGLERRDSTSRRGPDEFAAIEDRLASIAGARILLVEDNALNQEVAAGLLAEAGLHVDAADDGRIALDMIAKEHYDLVLMDMQMPVMDGIEATIAIRRIPEFQKLPIVAMTANATSHDRDACFAAGMNDFVAKPIEPGLLWKTLSRWIPPHAPDPSASVSLAGDDHEALSVPAFLPGIDVASGLRRTMGKKSLYLSFLRKFAETHADAVDVLRRSLAEGDRVGAVRVAHTIKGLAGGLGATELQQRAEGVELALKNSATFRAEDLVAAFAEELEEVIQGIRRHVPEEPSPMVDSGAVQATPEEVSGIVNRLEELLADNDAEAVDLFEAKAGILIKALGAAFDRVRAAIRAYDFESARAIIGDSSLRTSGEPKAEAKGEKNE
ncbi:MAG: PAS domain S-box protein [Treponema sp.]|nr:PAS domain S-box protein [Treponema sp.]